MECKTIACQLPTAGKSKYCRDHRQAARASWLERVRASEAERAGAYEALAELFERAAAAGEAAGAAAIPDTMIVSDERTGENWHVPEGPCGFASVIIRPGTSRAARFAKIHHNARRAYYGGTAISVHSYGQSVTRKSAHAEAMAAVLREGGVNARAESRLD